MPSDAVVFRGRLRADSVSIDGLPTPIMDGVVVTQIGDRTISVWVDGSAAGIVTYSTLTRADGTVALEIESTASDGSNYEPNDLQTYALVSDLIFGHKERATVTLNQGQVSLTNSTTELLLTTKLSRFDWKSRPLVWGSLLIFPSFIAMVFAIFSSPGFWFDEAYSPPYCFKFWTQTDDRWFWLAILFSPLSTCAVLFGLLTQRRRAQARALRAVAFPGHRQAAIIVAVVGSTMFAARALFHASFHYADVEDWAGKTECLSQLRPGPLAASLSPLLLVFLFVLGTRALDYD